MDDVQNEPENVEIDAAVDLKDSENQNANPEQEEAVTFDEKQQAKVNEIINQKVSQTYKERQRAEALEKELAEIKAKAPTPEAPTIPELPDPDNFDTHDEYVAKMKERDEAIAKSAEFNAQQSLMENQKAAAAQRQEQEIQQKRQEELDAYAKTAQSFKIPAEQMQQDANTVISAGISGELADHLVADPQGPLITNYLAKNVLELENVRAMNPMQAAIHIATVIKPKLAGAVSTTNAPAPVEIIGGKGAPEKVHPALEGATLE